MLRAGAAAGSFPTALPRPFSLAQTRIFTLQLDALSRLQNGDMVLPLEAVTVPPLVAPAGNDGRRTSIGEVSTEHVGVASSSAASADCLLVQGCPMLPTRETPSSPMTEGDGSCSGGVVFCRAEAEDDDDGDDGEEEERGHRAKKKNDKNSSSAAAGTDQQAAAAVVNLLRSSKTGSERSETLSASKLLCKFRQRRQLPAKGSPEGSCAEDTKEEAAVPAGGGAKRHRRCR